MKLKKIIAFLLLAISIVIIYFVLYKKSYHINIKPENVYEIQTQISGPYHVDTITDSEELETYLEEVEKLQFTHPHIFTGKGWTKMVTIKMRNKDGILTDYRYTISGDYISIGSFRYNIISK